jgi:heme O synthase-like polyprenyltransferase
MTSSDGARVSVVYPTAMVVCAVVVGVASAAGTIYMVMTLLAGTAHVAFAWQFMRHRAFAPARRLFCRSLIVLPLLLTALIADLLLG